MLFTLFSYSKTGEFCAIKEVEFVRDDPKSKDSAKQLAQVYFFYSLYQAATFYFPTVCPNF